jgi:hypothetical protein
VRLDRDVEDDDRDDDRDDGLLPEPGDDQGDQNERPGGADYQQAEAPVVEAAGSLRGGGPAIPTSPNTPMTVTENEKGGALSRNLRDVQNIVNTAKAAPPSTRGQRTARSRLTIEKTEPIRAG